MNHHSRRFSVTLTVAMAFLASTYAPTQADGTYAGGNQYIEQPAQIASAELENQETPTAAQDRAHRDVRAKPRSRGYVAITLKPEVQKDATPQQQKTAIKKVQDQMLARMGAEEFKLVYRFKSTAMLVGHLKAAGLAKLNEDPKVVSVAPSKIRADVFAKLQESEDGTVRVIVNVKPVTQGAPGSAQRSALVKQVQDRVLSNLSAQEFKATVRFRIQPDLAGYANSAGLAKLQAHSDVTGVALPRFGTTKTSSSVPFINADLVHALGYTGLGVTVAVIDTGIDYGAPGLQDGIASGGTSYEGGVEYADGGADLYGFGHGTYMSLIITDPTGVAPNARILPINVFGADGMFDFIDLALGIEYVILRRNADSSIRVINLSLGGFEYFPCICDEYGGGEALVAVRISDAAGAGIITFAATGNEAVCGGIISPACASDAVPVTASYDGDYSTTYFGPPADCGDLSPDPHYITCFSNHVEECNEIAAPGFDITVGGFSADGTSQATAHSSGLGALMFEKNACGSLDPYEARATIYNTAWDFWFAYPFCVLPPPPRHINALPTVNAVSTGGCGSLGDLDCDSTVSAADLASFGDCMTGPGGGPVVGFCRCGDAPSSPPDGDVDLRDLQAFQLAFTGPGVGACCHSDGSCTDGPVPDCIAVFGARYQGHNTTCAGTACPSPNLGACCDAAGGPCADDVGEADCSFGGGTYQGGGTTCATTTCPTIRYRNVIDPLSSLHSSGPGMKLGDDMVLDGAGACELVFYDLAVLGFGGGEFDVTAGLYDKCPGSGGTLIPGTQVTWTGLPDSQSPVFLQAYLDPVTIPNSVWMVATFSTPQAAWFIAEAAETGSTLDKFARNDPPWECNYWFLGNPYAGFWANLGCVE